ncbi:MAG: histidine phosphatase family protein [Pyrinomonadaceae bacterium]|nr:histidine phosphatase family protein [Pyrinomonadaceae bacterium]
MLPRILLPLLLVFVVSLAPEVSAQDKTIILVRHAEKDASETADPNDPDLTAEGRERAQRLIKAAGRYKPGAFYSTNFKRTRDTITPWAQKRGKTVEIYDHRKPQELLDKIMASKTKRFVIAGHSNSTPGVVNLLVKKDLFKNLDESVYTVIWVVKIRDGKVKKVEVLEY